MGADADPEPDLKTKPSYEPQLYDGAKPYRLVGSIRLLMFFMALTGSAVLGGGFGGFNFAIVCMVNETNPSAGGRLRLNGTGTNGNWTTGGRGAVQQQQCKRTDEFTEGYDGEFRWDRSVQANLIAAHAYGALVANIPSGLVSDRYGSRWVLVACLVCNALANLVTPIAARAGVAWVFAARVVQGLAYGGSWPTLVSIIPRWSTSTETSLMFSLIALGYHVGNLLANVSASALCYSTFRWPVIFYMWGVISLLYGLIWLAVYRDNPRGCRFVSAHELAYLQQRKMMRRMSSILGTGDDGAQRSFWDVPWLRLLFTPGALATHMSQFATTWATYYVGEYMPTYSKDVLMVDVRSNGLISSLPWLSLIFARNVFGLLGDRISFRGRSNTFGVKVFNAIGTLLPALCFVALGFLDCSSTVLAVAAFCVATTALASSTVGYGRGGVLMAPAYSGALASISNTCGDVGALVMPYLVGWMAGRGTVPEWQHTAWLTAAVMAAAFLVYQAFGTAKPQAWARQQPRREKQVTTAKPNSVFAVTQTPQPQDFAGHEQEDCELGSIMKL